MCGGMFNGEAFRKVVLALSSESATLKDEEGEGERDDVDAAEDHPGMFAEVAGVKDRELEEVPGPFSLEVRDVRGIMPDNHREPSCQSEERGGENRNGDECKQVYREKLYACESEAVEN